MLDIFEERVGAFEDDLKAALMEKFQLGLISPFSKTYISIDDAGRLTLKMPGLLGKIILEKGEDNDTR